MIQLPAFVIVDALDGFCGDVARRIVPVFRTREDAESLKTSLRLDRTVREITADDLLKIQATGWRVQIVDPKDCGRGSGRVVEHGRKR